MAPLNPSVERLLGILAEIPELNDMLTRDRLVRLRVYQVLVRHAEEFPVSVRDDEHTLVDCYRAVHGAGYRIQKSPTERPVGGREEEATFSPWSQMGRMLSAFAEAGDAGLTDDIAAEMAGVSGAASPWRRASSLRELGLIEVVHDENDNVVVRTGMRGSARTVSRITDAGAQYLEEMA